MKISQTREGNLKIRYGKVWGEPKVKIYISEYEYLLKRNEILEGVEKQLDSEKWAFSIIGIKDLEPYIKEIQKANKEWEKHYNKLKLESGKKITMLESHLTLNAKPFAPSNLRND